MVMGYFLRCFLFGDIFIYSIGFFGIKAFSASRGRLCILEVSGILLACGWLL